MNSTEIGVFLKNHELKLSRTIVIVDFGNVEEWKYGLNWRVGVRELGVLAKHFSKGKNSFVDFTMVLITDLLSSPRNSPGGVVEC